MHDIRLALGLMGFLSVAVFLVLLRALRGRSHVFLDLTALLIVVLIGTYVYTVWGQLWIVRWIPLPSVIVLSNWFPPMLAALGVVVWRRMESASIPRRLPIMLIILTAGIYAATYFVPTEPPQCGDEWSVPPAGVLYPVCRQTTPNTCSAAAAATILNVLGISATEQEMAELCMTRSGTTWLGLYHGMAVKLMETPLQVTFFDEHEGSLREYSRDYPVLLCCQLDPEVAAIEPRYVESGGWIPEQPHSVVYFGMQGDLHLIGDPSRGFEWWTPRDLAVVWTGTGLRIEPAGAAKRL